MHVGSAAVIVNRFGSHQEETAGRGSFVGRFLANLPHLLREGTGLPRPLDLGFAEQRAPTHQREVDRDRGGGDDRGGLRVVRGRLLVGHLCPAAQRFDWKPEGAGQQRTLLDENVAGRERRSRIVLRESAEGFEQGPVVAIEKRAGQRGADHARQIVRQLAERADQRPQRADAFLLECVHQVGGFQPDEVPLGHLARRRGSTRDVKAQDQDREPVGRRRNCVGRPRLRFERRHRHRCRTGPFVQRVQLFDHSSQHRRRGLRCDVANLVLRQHRRKSQRQVEQQRWKSRTACTQRRNRLIPSICVDEGMQQPVNRLLFVRKRCDRPPRNRDRRLHRRAWRHRCQLGTEPVDRRRLGARRCGKHRGRHRLRLAAIELRRDAFVGAAGALETFGVGLGFTNLDELQVRAPRCLRVPQPR